MEEIMWTWPARRFEGAFARHLTRKARERARDLRDQMIVAFSAVTEFDKQEDRTKALESVRENYDKTVELLHAPRDAEHEVVDEVTAEMEDDPIFRPMMVNRAPQQIKFPNEGAGQAILERDQ